MVDYLSIIRTYYSPGDLYETLIAHSRQVAGLSLQLAKSCGLNLDMQFIEEAAMMHDIGIFKTHAPSIFCIGDEPYIRHGIIGGEILRNRHNQPRHALVCERHTGAGLSAHDIIAQDLPLPHTDFLPVSDEEQLICYADKFFSKSHIAPIKPFDKVRESLMKFGPETLQRFDLFAKKFGIPE